MAGRCSERSVGSTFSNHSSMAARSALSRAVASAKATLSPSAMANGHFEGQALQLGYPHQHGDGLLHRARAKVVDLFEEAAGDLVTAGD